MSHFPDPQAEAVYWAEESVPDWANGRVFKTQRQAREWLYQVTNAKGFHRRFPQFTALAVHGLATSSRQHSWRSDDGVSHVVMPKRLPSELDLLHQLAHALGIHGHGPDFCEAYLHLVRRALGEQAHAELKRQFVQQRVVYTLDFVPCLAKAMASSLRRPAPAKAATEAQSCPNTSHVGWEAKYDQAAAYGVFKPV